MSRYTYLEHVEIPILIIDDVLNNIFIALMKWLE